MQLVPLHAFRALSEVIGCCRGLLGGRRTLMLSCVGQDDLGTLKRQLENRDVELERLQGEAHFQSTESREGAEKGESVLGYTPAQFPAPHNCVKFSPKMCTYPYMHKPKVL